MARLIGAVRRELHLTQEEFAHVVGVTVSTVNRWENARVEPSRLARKMIEELARRAGLDVETRLPNRPF